jgi:ligand-binding sensor domain-containing protein/DNA-binding CsgD family transcriptional regulator
MRNRNSRFTPVHRLMVWLWLLAAMMSGNPALAHDFVRAGSTKGLEARVVPALLVDREGFLWVGSREGLFRYDGYQAIAFRPDPANPHAISDFDIRTAYEARDGDIWIGTNTGGLNRYHRSTGQFSQYRADSGRDGAIPDDSIYAIAEGPEGDLWVSTQVGLARLDRNTDTFQVYRHDPAIPGSLSANWAFHLHLGQSGQFWISTIGGGLNRWNPATEDFTHFDLAELTGGPATRNDVFTIHEGDDGRVWLGTRSGLVVLDPQESTARYFDMGETEGFQPVITAMVADGSGNLWLASMLRGILRVNMESGEWQPANPGELGAAGNLPAQPQMSLAITAGQLFVGTWGEGLFRTPLRDLPFQLLARNTANDGQTTLRNVNISAILGGETVGHAWLGSFGGGPQKVDVVNGEVLPSAGKLDSIAVSGVLDMARDAQGNLFAATTAGLYRFDEQGGELQLDSHEAAGGIGPGYVYALLPADNDDLWVGLGGSGLYLRNAKTGSFRAFRHDPAKSDSLSGDFITDLADGMPGYLWVATRSSGLNYCRVENWSCQRFSGLPDDPYGLSHYHVTALHRDRRGHLWVATDGGGINRVEQDEDGKVSSFEHFGQDEGLLNEGIMAIEEDVDESLWLSTRHGLSRINPATGQVINYVAESGLPTSHFNTNASAADEGLVYFGSVDGLLSIRKGSLLEQRDPSALRLTRIQSQAKGQAPKTVQRQAGIIEIPFGEVITVEFASLDFSESTHAYAYRLNADAAWTDLGNQRQITFHGLRPGAYQLQARGRDVYGLWGESAALPLRVVPPFWMTTWFRLLLALALVSLAFGLHRLHLSRQQAITREVQRLSEKRETALEQALGSQAELAVLTPRQKEILQLIAEGHATREIAGMLNLSIKTVEAHRANLMERLEIRDIPGLVRLAIRSRLVSPHQ